MQEISYSKIISTPLDISQKDPSEENDSGYHSNLSYINWSSNISKGNWSDHNLSGGEFVDFLYYFGERSDYSIIIKKILSYLNDEDLHNVTAVSRIWKNVVMSVSSERRRFRSYLKELETSKENRNKNTTECGDNYEDKSYQSPRGTLMQIHNIRKEFTLSNSPVSSSSPQLIRNNYRYEAYQKEGRKVKLGRRLFSCPKCKLPSHIDQKIPNTAECTNSTCRYRFCILCQCGEHHSKICYFISTPIARKQNVSVGTIASKKNLKRLLL